MDSLKFIETMSVTDFKAKMGVKKIDVKQNPNTGNASLYMAVKQGAVSERFLKGDITKPVISQVCSPETGDMFYMLHQQGDGGAPTLQLVMYKLYILHGQLDWFLIAFFIFLIVKPLIVFI